MRSGFFLILLAVRTVLASDPPDPRLKQALPAIAHQASQLWHIAPDCVAEETLRQRTLGRTQTKRLHVKAVKAPAPEFQQREIVAMYGLAGLRATPEAIREFRRIVSIDGKELEKPDIARHQLAAQLTRGTDEEKQELWTKFDAQALGGSAVDFGQLILLFTKANLSKYSFDLYNIGNIGADRSLIINFEQHSGKESLNIEDGDKRSRQALQGEIWVRDPDFEVLRITLKTTRRDHDRNIRDEASVDYQSGSSATLLPASVVHRRFINDDLFAENNAQYGNWECGGAAH